VLVFKKRITCIFFHQEHDSVLGIQMAPKTNLDPHTSEVIKRHYTISPREEWDESRRNRRNERDLESILCYCQIRGLMLCTCLSLILVSMKSYEFALKHNWPSLWSTSFMCLSLCISIVYYRRELIEYAHKLY
jgi:hypothetical protein